MVVLSVDLMVAMSANSMELIEAEMKVSLTVVLLVD
jgi:hypothetical protein